MTGTGTGPAGPPVALSPQDFPWEPLDVPGEAQVRTVLGPGDSESLGAGFARFVDVTFDWELGYDEVLHVLEGRVTVEHGEGTFEAQSGDVVLIPSGNRVTYSFRGACTVFFATYPVDWAERSDG